jgi:thiol-disulfide isomerase/thioredoxin
VAEGFQHTPPSPVISMPRPSWPPPPPTPQWEGVQDDRAPQSSGPPPIVPSVPPSSVHLPNLPTHVPSCVLVGNKLENFALKDLNGETWEYRRNRQGRLVLLDFWYSTCGACTHAIPRLVDLQKKYGSYKLEVIGIACETGPVDQAIGHVRNVRARYSINYLTLMSGGGPESCPVVNQFRVEKYPTLVLLDESGRLIWRSSNDGMDTYAWQTLEQLISNRLFQQR